MIVVERKTRRVIHADPITPEQNERFWEKYIQAAAPAAIGAAMEDIRSERKGSVSDAPRTSRLSCESGAAQ